MLFSFSTVANDSTNDNAVAQGPRWQFPGDLDAIEETSPFLDAFHRPAVSAASTSYGDHVELVGCTSEQLFCAASRVTASSSREAMG